jgi:hypothetical protein
LYFFGCEVAMICDVVGLPDITQSLSESPFLLKTHQNIDGEVTPYFDFNRQRLELWLSPQHEGGLLFLNHPHV